MVTSLDHHRASRGRRAAGGSVRRIFALSAVGYRTVNPVGDAHEIDTRGTTVQRTSVRLKAVLVTRTRRGRHASSPIVRDDERAQRRREAGRTVPSGADGHGAGASPTRSSPASAPPTPSDRKSTRLNSSHLGI